MYSDSESSRSDDSTEAKSSQAASSSTLMRCAYCGKKFEKEASPILPFCSKRCHQIDLGMWLNESHGMPYEGEGAPDGQVE